MTDNTSADELVHQITVILVKNRAKITPETTWVHDFTELITSYTKQRELALLERLENTIRRGLLAAGTNEEYIWANTIAAVQKEKEKLV